MRRTPTAKIEKFLEILEQFGRIATAANEAGIGRATIYRWQIADPQLAGRMANAIAAYEKSLEDRWHQIEAERQAQH